MSIFFSWCLLIIPWVFIPMKDVVNNFRTPKATFFDIICMGMIVIGIKKGLKFSYANKYLSWLVLWVFISLLFNWYFPYTFSFHGYQVYNYIVFEPMVHFILGLFMTLLALGTFTKEDYERFAKILCLSGVLVSIFGIMQILGFDPYGKMSHYKMVNHFTAVLDNPMLAGNYLALCFPFTFAFIKDKRFIFAFITIFTGIILSRSSISLIVAFLSILIFIFLKLKHLKYTRLSYLILIMWVVLTCRIFFDKIINSVLGMQGMFYGRIACWQLTVPRIKDNPLFGQGFGIFHTFLLKTGADTWWYSAHNDYLQFIVEIGILGLILFLIVVVNSLRKFNYSKDNTLGFVYYTSFISFLLLMGGSFVVETAPVVLIGLLSFWGVEKL